MKTIGSTTQRILYSLWCRFSLNTGIQRDVIQAAKPTDMSGLISDDEMGSLIARHQEGRTEEFTKAMAARDAISSKS